MKQLNFLFIVQGEGRGHMTQAITAGNMLIRAGHKISCVLIGINPHREIPDFVRQQLQTDICAVDCPGFIMDSKIKSVKLIPSIVSNLVRIPVFIKSVGQIHKKVRQHKPDRIVNFYTPLAGIYAFFYKPSVPFICIAHQYIYLHPEYIFPKGRYLDRFAIRFYTRMTALRSEKKLALSFYPLKDYPDLSLFGFPPLLRKEVVDRKTSEGNYLLVYLVNSGYAEEIIKWHTNNPQTELHCFTDSRERAQPFDDKLFFQYLDDKKFIELMAGCRGLVSTAGFESVCEAKYMGKPVFMVPVEGNYEQYCNAHDACKVGTGITDSQFRIERFLDFLSKSAVKKEEFRKWADTAAEKLILHLTV